MPRQCRYLLHRRVAPNIDLVLAISVCRNQLVDVLGEHEIADLTSSLY